MPSRMRFVLVFAAGLIVATTSNGAPAAKGPLSTLPSKASAHIEKIQALGDNQWVNLGAPAADPKWGKARGSSWGAKALILAPELRGAFLFGEGVHAFVKPDGHAMDDLWFYDIHAHRWMCLHPGTNTKTFTQRVKDKELFIDDTGLLRDNDGQAIPVHTLIHAWGYLAYDPDRKKFAFLGNTGLGRYFLGGEKQMDEGVKLLEEQLKGKKTAAFSPWYYDVTSGRFERTRATGAGTGSTGGMSGSFPQVHYLASKKQFYVVGTSGVGIFNPAKNQWSEANPKGPMPKGYEGCGCHDSKRNRIYRNDGDAGDGRGLMAYDIESNTWIELKPKGTAPAAGNTNAAYYEYDARLDKVVVIYFREKAAGIFVYDPETNSWAAPIPFPADGPKFQFAANTCYDRELNAYFCHVAGDSSDNGIVWAYRYKKAIGEIKK